MAKQSKASSGKKAKAGKSAERSKLKDLAPRRGAEVGGGKRSQVGNAHDKYANQEIKYDG